MQNDRMVEKDIEERMANKVIQTNNHLFSIECNIRFRCQRYTKSVRVAANRVGVDRVIFIDIHEIRWTVLLHFDNKPSGCIFSSNSSETRRDIP
jgi:hypothetical protein